MDSAANDVRDKIARVVARLPDDADQPRVEKADTDARAIIWIGFTSNQLDSIQTGDINSDGTIDVLDIVELVNMVLNLQETNNFADINNDGTINIQDIILLINIILNN